MAEKLKKLGIYMHPELKAAARNAAKAEGLSLSAWFRKQLRQDMEHGALAAATNPQNRPKQPSN
ncbi:MAG: hypothetical protein V4772_16795 [Pseudomonadota bacterium]